MSFLPLHQSSQSRSLLSLCRLSAAGVSCLAFATNSGTRRALQTNDLWLRLRWLSSSCEPSFVCACRTERGRTRERKARDRERRQTALATTSAGDGDCDCDRQRTTASCCCFSYVDNVKTFGSLYCHCCRRCRHCCCCFWFCCLHDDAK